MKARRALALLLAAMATAACAKDAVPTKRAAPGAATGGELTIGIGRPQTLDPTSVDVRDVPATTVLSMLCDTLVTLDPETGAPLPGIAESWVVSDAGRVLVLKLRRGVKFHDGQTVTADDVRFTLSRIAGRDFASPSASILEHVVGYDQVHGNAEVKDDRAREELAGVTTIENYSLQIALADDQNMGELFRALAHPATAPVPRRAVRADPGAFADRPLCAGPYRLAAAWKDADPTITLERFSGYHGKNPAFTRGGAGYPDRIVYRVYTDDAAREQAVAAGEVDVTNVSASSAYPGQTVTASTPSLTYLGLPVRKEPFTLRGVRLALSQALDREALAAVAGIGRTPARGVLPPAVGPLFREDACGARMPVSADAAAAREALADAALTATDVKIRLHFNDEYGHRALVSAVAEQWRAALGVEVELVGLQWEEYLQKVASPDGVDGPFLMTWQPQYVGAHQYLHPLLSSDSVGRENFTRFDNAAFETRLRTARRASTDDDVEVGYGALEDVACQELPILPLLYGSRRYAVGPGVGSAVSSTAALGTGQLAWRELFVTAS